MRNDRVLSGAKFRASETLPFQARPDTMRDAFMNAILDRHARNEGRRQCDNGHGRRRNGAILSKWQLKGLSARRSARVVKHVFHSV